MKQLLRSRLVMALPLSLICGTVQVQTDEIIVTASHISLEDTISGQVLMVRGDNLLLEVRIGSDARDLSERLEEIEATNRSFTQAANQNATVSLPYIDGNSVRPLSASLYKDAIGRGSRPDTSVATIQLKTLIPGAVEDSFALPTQLTRFIQSIPETGRISIENTDEIVISVINPEQYRPAVIKQITKEIGDIRDQPGSDYKIVLQDIDRPIERYRASDLALGFYISYSYRVIPTLLDGLQIDIWPD